MNKQEPSLYDFFIPLTTKKAISFLIIIGIVVYFNALFNGFVGDDNAQIVSNNLIHSVKNIPSFFTVSTFNLGNGISGLYFKPLLLAAYALIYSVFGQNPFVFHLLQVALYTLNAILVFLLFKKFITKEISFFLAVIFLVHPINEEVAAYISNYQDLLFFFFGMMALLFASSKKSKYSDLKVFVMLALSLLSKETGIVFCLINLTYALIFRKEKLKTTLAYTLLLVIPYFIIRTHAVGLKTSHDFRIGRVSLSARLLNIPKLTTYYLMTFIYPAKLAVSYDWIVSSLNFSGFFAPLFVVLTFVGALAIAGNKILTENIKTFRSFLFFAIWFFLGLAIHMQIIPLDGVVAPRWFYLPMVGFLGMIGVIFETFVKSQRAKRFFLISFFVVATVFSARTIVRNSNFENNLTLMCHDAEVSGDNFTLENSCGISLFTLGRYDEAQKHFERSVSLAPYYGTNWWGLGITYGKKAEINKNKELYNKSVNAFKMAIRIEPEIPWSYQSLGYLYAHYDDHKTAKDFLEKSLKKFPNDYVLWLNYGYLENKIGDSKNALGAIKNAYILNPNDPQISLYYYNLSNNRPIEAKK